MDTILHFTSPVEYYPYTKINLPAPSADFVAHTYTYIHARAPSHLSCRMILKETHKSEDKVLKLTILTMGYQNASSDTDANGRRSRLYVIRGDDETKRW